MSQEVPVELGHRVNDINAIADPASRIELYGRLLGEYPNSSIAAFNLALELWQSGRQEAACDAARRAIGIAPELIDQLPRELAMLLHGSAPVAGEVSSDRLGERVAGFRITHRIAEDPRTLVYRTERGPERGYLRVLRRSLSQDPPIATRFIESAKLLQRVRHPGLATILEAGRLPDGCAYVLVQPAPGELLSDRIWREAPLGSLAPALGSLAEALASLHAEGGCYLGLQPERVQVVAGPAPGLQLLDSEHVRARALQLPVPTIANGPVRERVDPVLFMAPETFSGGAEVGPPADVYALGVLAYLVLCGRPPLQAGSIGEVIAAHLNQAPAPLRSVAPEIPQELAGLVEAMLDKDPGRRPSMAIVAEQWARAFAPAARPAAPASAREAPAPAAPELGVGSLLEGYRLIRKLGEGRTGVVFEGYHERLRRRDAIKVIRPEYCRSEEDAERFLREAQAANQVAHPGIVSILQQARTPGGQIYTVMELLEGASLRDRIARGPRPAAEVRQLGRHIALAVAAAHERGIIHRDLKPENVIVVRDPDVPSNERTKIVDFGTANLTESSARVGAYVEGTPGYMSPEQLRDTRTAGTKTDVYALGVILQEMLVGERRSGAELPASCPPSLAALIRQMKELDPGRRPDMQQVAARLARPPRSRWPRLALAAAAVVGAAGLAIGVWQLLPDKSDERETSRDGSGERRPPERDRDAPSVVATPEEMLALQHGAMVSGEGVALSALLRARAVGSETSHAYVRDQVEGWSRAMARLDVQGIRTQRQQIRYQGEVAWAMQELVFNAGPAGEHRFVISQVMIRDRGSWKVAVWHWSKPIEDQILVPDPPPIRGTAPRPIAMELDRIFASKEAFIAAISERRDVINVGTNAEFRSGGAEVRDTFERLKAQLRIRGGAGGDQLKPDVAWGAANVDFRYGKNLESSTVFGVFAVLVKEPAGWRVVFSHWSRGGA